MDRYLAHIISGPILLAIIGTDLERVSVLFLEKVHRCVAEQDVIDFLFHSRSLFQHELVSSSGGTTWWMCETTDDAAHPIICCVCACVSSVTMCQRPSFLFQLLLQVTLLHQSKSAWFTGRVEQRPDYQITACIYFIAPQAWGHKSAMIPAQCYWLFVLPSHIDAEQIYILMMLPTERGSARGSQMTGGRTLRSHPMPSCCSGKSRRRMWTLSWTSPVPPG